MDQTAWARLCPWCERRYEPGAAVCEHDGRPLFAVEPGESPEIGRQLAPGLTVLSRLGAGGYGQVYRAVQHATAREVAVKLLRPEAACNADAVRRFEREAQTLTQLAHPHIVAIFDLGQTVTGETFLVMEWLRGRSLKALIKRDAPLDPARARAIAAQIADALAWAHDHGVVHRDLTPGNIFIHPELAGHDDYVTILDFGLARVSAPDATESWTSRGGRGTPAYMSPEQAVGRAADHRSDLYALGMICFEMLTGQRPYSPNTELAHRLSEPPPMPEGLDAEWATLLRELLAPVPAERPQSASEVRARLRAAIVPAAPPQPPSAKWPRPGTFAAVIVIAAAAALALAWPPSPAPTQEAPMNSTPQPPIAEPATPPQPAAGPPTGPLMPAVSARPQHHASRRARHAVAQLATPPPAASTTPRASNVRRSPRRVTGRGEPMEATR